MPELGHMAYYVRNLERSVAFYEKVVGLTVVGRIFGGRAAVLSGGRSHHELLLIQVSTADGPLVGRRIGLYHAGWKVGDSLAELKEALDRAQLYGYNVDSATDHSMMFSIYLRDPDDNEVELFVDDPEYDWKQDKSWMEAPVKPLDISTCLIRTGKSPAKTNKIAERQPPVPSPVHFPIRESYTPVQPTQAREPLQSPAAVQQGMPTAKHQVQVPSRANQSSPHTQHGSVEFNKAARGTADSPAIPRQYTDSRERIPALPEQPRLFGEPQAKVPSESQAKVLGDPPVVKPSGVPQAVLSEPGQQQQQEPQTSLPQNLNQVIEPQPDMGYGNIMQNMPHVGNQFDDNALSTHPQFGGEQLMTTASMGDDEEAHYHMENAAA